MSRMCLVDDLQQQVRRNNLLSFIIWTTVNWTTLNWTTHALNVNQLGHPARLKLGVAGQSCRRPFLFGIHADHENTHVVMVLCLSACRLTPATLALLRNAAHNVIYPQQHDGTLNRGLDGLYL